MCQTVLNQTRYPSVLLLVCQDKDQHKPDIHFFHCDEVEVSVEYAWLSLCLCVQVWLSVCYVIHKLVSVAGELDQISLL